MAAERGPGRRKPCPLRRAQPPGAVGKAAKQSRSPGPCDVMLNPSQKLVGCWASVNLVSSIASRLTPQESMEASQEDVAEARLTATNLEQNLPPEMPSPETFSCDPASCPPLPLEHQAAQLSGEYLQMYMGSMEEPPLHSNLASTLFPAVPISDVPLLPASEPPSPGASCMGESYQASLDILGSASHANSPILQSKKPSPQGWSLRQASTSLK